MGRPKNLVPTVRRHATPGQPDRAVVDYYDAAGRRRMRTLGEYGSEAAVAAYRRLLADLEAARPVSRRP